MRRMPTDRPTARVGEGEGEQGEKSSVRSREEEVQMGESLWEGGREERRDTQGRREQEQSQGWPAMCRE